MPSLKLFAGLISAVPLFGLATWSALPQGQSVNFARQIRPILNESCIGCHGSQNPSAGLDLSSSTGISKGGKSKNLIVPNKPEDSLLYLRISSAIHGPQMPAGKPPLSPAKTNLIKSWIAEGAVLPKPLTFIQDVAPILKANCISCHGPKDPAAGLSVLVSDSIKRVIKSRDPKNSVLLRRIRGLDGKPQMPKGFAPLSAHQIETLESWIESGASFAGEQKQHWAYIAPKRPAIPSADVPEWSRNPIDPFILVKLRAAKLTPAQRATKEELLRRVYLDLIGLVPTIEEVDAFIADTSPDAYERIVDKLLASQQFGEKQAISWLDLSRYADTDGYERDPMRNAWMYRDWLINALNANLPYDQFVIQQIAGDLLPDATLEQKIATGFSRNSMHNVEGGVDPEEARYEVINDRVATTTQVFMSQTLACARCHDHKFDPFSQKDYFKLYAFFSNTSFDVVGDSNIGEQKYVERNLPIATPAYTKRVKELSDHAKELDAAIEKQMTTSDAWWRNLQSADLRPPQWTPLDTVQFSSRPPVTAKLGNGQVTIPSPVPPNAIFNYRGTASRISRLSAIRIRAIPDASNPANGAGKSSSGNFILSKAVLKVGAREVPLALARADFVQPGYDASGLLDDEAESGWAISPRYNEAHDLVIQPESAIQIAPGDEVDLELRFMSKQWAQHLLGNFRVDVTDAQIPMYELMPAALRDALPKPNSLTNPTPELNKLLQEFTPKLRVLVEARKKVSSDLSRLDGTVPSAMVMSEKPSEGTLKAHIRNRGEFTNKAELVDAGTPDSLPVMDAGLPKNRLGLARWLASKSNPLTARVQVNRIWESLFGVGLVETSENFGVQGSPPSHPELLDWLAVEFMDRDWDTKAIYRLIVTSETYRQSSASTIKKQEIDPRNRLLSRSPRYRLSAESIRDVALQVSGLLNKTIGGPSVYPPQPAGIWNSPYSGEKWEQSQGENQYRRGLYTFWKRTATYPAFTTFDAPTRQQCTVRRSATNTPLQSLVLLNDVVFLQCARALAAHTIKSSGTDDEKITNAFRTCTGRKPEPKELARLVKLLSTLRATYSKDEELAKKLAPSVEEAAWTMLSSTILNLDETISRG